MDYKYIEQLLDRYWEAETSLMEEDILRCFFRQSRAAIPEHLQRYISLFKVADEARQCEAPAHLEAKILARLDAASPKRVKARSGARFMSFHPFYKAVACVSLFMMVGIGAQYSFTSTGNGAWDYNPSTYTDSYTSERQAYKVAEKGLQIFERTANADSTTKQSNDVSPSAEEE